MAKKATKPNRNGYSADTRPRSTTYADDDEQSAIRGYLGLHNNGDMFLTDFEPFLAHYLPINITDAEIDACVSAMLSERSPLLRKTRKQLFWTSFHERGSGIYGAAHEAFQPLEQIVEKIIKYNPREMREKAHFRLCPDKWLINDINGGTFKIDACFTEITQRKAIENRYITLPIGLTQERTKGSRMMIHQHILGACHHLLSEDPRRMWIFGLTFENDVVSAWYFSRSHSVKTFAANWVEKPRLLIKIILSLVNADRSALGIDPLVHVGPLSADKKTFSYVYEVPREVTGGTPVFYKTGQIRSHSHSMCTSGRTTRVWEVTQVTAADGKVEVNPGKKAVLKDVWLPIGTTTEAENLEKIFDAIDAFVSTRLDAEIRDELEKTPGTLHEAITSNAAMMERLVKQLIDNEKRFQHFDEATKERLRVYFTDKQYRSMFLTKLHARKGMISKGLGPSAAPCPNLFREVFPPVLDDQYIGTAVPSVRTSTMDDNLSRQQMRVIYDEVCDSLCEMETLADVVDILCQAIDALHILYAVGWVHRDISSGNILAMKTGDNTTWQVKLADFEFARPMTDETRTISPDPTIGTAFFMPTEILSRQYLYESYLLPEFVSHSLHVAPLRGRKGNTLATLFNLSVAHPAYAKFKQIQPITCLDFDPTLPPDFDPDNILPPGSIVNHNFQHDLESIWWILLWFVTMNVNCATSFDWAHDIFDHDISKFKPRKLLFTNVLNWSNPVTNCMRPELEPIFPPLLEALRSDMQVEYILREVTGLVGVPESYSVIQGRFAAVLRLIATTDGDWRDLSIKCGVDPRVMDFQLARPGANKLTTVGSKHGCDEDEPRRTRSGAEHGRKKTKTGN